MKNVIFNHHKPHPTSELCFTGKKLVRPTNSKIWNKQFTTVKGQNIFVEFTSYKCIESKTYMVKMWEHSVEFCYIVKPNYFHLQKRLNYYAKLWIGVGIRGSFINF